MNPSQRSVNKDGFLRSGAKLLRAGTIDYSRNKIGLDGEGASSVNRTRDTMGKLIWTTITIVFLG